MTRALNISVHTHTHTLQDTLLKNNLQGKFLICYSLKYLSLEKFKTRMTDSFPALLKLWQIYQQRGKH